MYRAIMTATPLNPDTNNALNKLLGILHDAGVTLVEAADEQDMTLKQLADWAAHGPPAEILSKLKGLYALHVELIILAARAKAAGVLASIMCSRNLETARRAATTILTLKLPPTPGSPPKFDPAPLSPAPRPTPPVPPSP